MSKFSPDFDYMKLIEIYYTPVVENVFDLIYRSRFEAVKSQVTKGVVEINSWNDKGQTLLHYALLYNQIKIAEFLISQGADLKAKDNSGQKVENLIQEKCPYIFENMHNDSLSSLTLVISDQELIKDDQIQELVTLKVVAV
ncbi:ankyrin repeat domain-containing protein [Candidatus Megaera polyxenophila]|uniref:ankyrin repeat domain-containing protein n=1 Tax=Candidatus Megaera polyxenophila TaxID=988779 RepID=UPI00249F039D|nr:ankyrin repeat domain-containing protein [Candidatus Megaera polyxenophila]